MTDLTPTQLTLHDLSLDIKNGCKGCNAQWVEGGTELMPEALRTLTHAPGCMVSAEIDHLLGYCLEKDTPCPFDTDTQGA